MIPTPADPVLLLAWWAGAAALALTAALAGAILVMRLTLLRRQRNYQQVVAMWRPVLAGAISGDTLETLPELSPARMVAFLKLWIHLHASLRGGATEQLNGLARRLGCGNYANALLASGRRTDVLLAILVLGYLRDASSTDLLLQRMRGTDAQVSINAAWALMQVAPERVADRVVDEALARPQWPRSRVVLILADGGLPVAEALAARLSALDDTQLPDALRIAEGIRARVPSALLAKLLGSGSNDVLVAALRLVADPALLTEVRRLAVHPDWRVRLQTAQALGRVGERGDAALLVDLLADREWWVRLRAAEALTNAPYLDPATIERMALEKNDPYALDMLRQVSSKGAGT